MSNLTDFIISHGVTKEILVMLLYIPLIATFINFSRYIIGLRTLGIYAPMTLAFAYVFTGIRFGLMITGAVIAATLLSYTVLKKIRMHYVSRITVNYILISAFVILVIVLNEVSPVKITSERHNVETLPPLGIILIATLSDFFIKQYVKKSLFTSVRSLMETVLVGVIGWAMLRSQTIEEFLLINLWVQPLLLVLNLSLGKYTGMRLKDFFRFGDIIKKD